MQFVSHSSVVKNAFEFKYLNIKNKIRDALCEINLQHNRFHYCLRKTTSMNIIRDHFTSNKYEENFNSLIQPYIRLTRSLSMKLRPVLLTTMRPCLKGSFADSVVSPLLVNDWQ